MTTEKKHTPGPWVVHGRRAALTVRDPSDRPVVELWLTDIGHDERHANADLIAAAPDLLEVCKQVLNRASMSDMMRLEIAAAIAKAMRSQS